MTARRHRGFTLIELLVALFITAIMFAFGYRALDEAFKSRREVDQQSARLIAVQQALRTLEQDFELLQPRPVRNLIGDGYMAALTAAQSTGIGSLGTTLGSTGGGTSSALGSVSSNGSAAPLVTFTRGGWTNPVGIQRSELQRVSYTLEKGVLTRQYYPVLDATEAAAPVKRALIDRVKNFSLRFMDAGHNWQSGWPPITSGAGSATTAPRLRPVAVEVTIELDDWGVLVRHIEVAG
ncbi:MAG TPA: type II secretion system minor pseudopilin GspJ [Steroidobacteraceae bacterium]|nr:type II secretion system minor pseudopilin GspJ [Steroidobacteraceae bacterium]